MTQPVLFAAAGPAELSPEEAKRLARTLLAFAATPFMVYCICVAVLLGILLRKPSRRQKLKGRTLLAFITLLATIGFLLLVPTLPFFFPISVWW